MPVRRCLQELRVFCLRLHQDHCLWNLRTMPISPAMYLYHSGPLSCTPPRKMACCDQISRRTTYFQEWVLRTRDRTVPLAPYHNTRRQRRLCMCRWIHISPTACMSTTIRKALTASMSGTYHRCHYGNQVLRLPVHPTIACTPLLRMRVKAYPHHLPRFSICKTMRTSHIILPTRPTSTVTRGMIFNQHSKQRKTNQRDMDFSTHLQH